MSAPTLSLAGIQANAVRRVETWTGAWFADVDLDTSDAVSVPSGRVELVLSGETFRCTVDPSASARFGSRVHVRVIAGGGGWGKLVPAKHFHNDAGVKLSTVIRATASEVGEQLGDIEDAVLGVDYVRAAGPASQVFGARDWHVSDEGVTVVRTRELVDAPETLQVLEHDVATSRTTCSSIGLVRPGWRLVDASRFLPLVVRDVEQNFGASGSSTTAWTNARAASPLLGLFRDAVASVAGLTHLRTYRYRVVGMLGNRVELQAVTRTAGVPDVIPAPMHMGVPGVHAELTPGTVVLLAFSEGDPARPMVVSFEPRDGDAWRPVRLELEATGAVRMSGGLLELDATEGVHVGTGGAAVVVGGFDEGPPSVSWFKQVETAVRALAGATSVTAPTPTASAKLTSE